MSGAAQLLNVDLPEAGLQAAGFAAVALVYLGYGVHLWRGGLFGAGDDRAARWLLAAVAGTALWGALGLADLSSTKVVTTHLTLALDHLRYACWALFLLQLVRPMAGQIGAARARFWAALPMLLLVTGLLANALLGFLPAPVPLLVEGLLVVQLIWPVFGLLLVEQLLRNQVDQKRWAAKPLCLGLGGLFLFDLYLFSQALMFGGFDGDVLAARGLVHALVMPLLLMASSRSDHWLARVQVSKTAAFYSASLLLIGAYLLFIAAVGYYVRFFGGTWGGALQVALLFAALVLLTVLAASGSLRARLRVFLGKNFFSYRYDYRLEWLRFTAMLSTRSSPQEVGALVVRGLADMVECSAGALWFKALGDPAFVQSAVMNMPELASGEPTDSPFSRFMAEREWIIDLQAARAGGGSSEEAALLPGWLDELPDAWLVVPLLVADDLLGFVVLARPRTAVALDWEVRDLLKTAARQAAGFLAQMHATEALLEARKFDAFNRMSAFVVHDLKNIITQLSLMLKNAERHRDNPEFQQDMLLTVESSLDKMRQMMLQLREGAKPAGVASGVEVAPILQRIEAAAQQRGRRLELQVVDKVATRGHAERLERVIGHVVQNALDATPASGRVWVRLAQDAGRALVEVGDTGAGMSAEFIQHRLFRPFNSTKTSGMGIGSYESFQYVKELGGSIDVKSELGKGTVVTLRMPLFDLRTGTDLRAPGVAA